MAYKKLVAEDPAGFPGYFAFLLAVAFVPAAGLYRSVGPFINWQAFSLTSFVVVLISLLWEATLALPYGWWGFQPRMMMGLTIGGLRGAQDVARLGQGLPRRADRPLTLVTPVSAYHLRHQSSID